MTFLSKDTIEETSKCQVHMHNVGLSHSHSEQMLEAPCEDNSLQEDFNMKMIVEFWMMINLSQVPHI